MKVSLNLAQFYSNVDLKSIPTNLLLKRIGAQLGAVEDVQIWGPQYEGIVVAKVVECIKHPNADKLSVCRVDDGGVVQNVERDHDGYVQVVCGAPNVREGLTVAWLPPGAIVPNTRDKDPFTLEAREIRGKVSNGMLASAHELGINDDHNGILEIDAKDVGKELTQPGTPFKDLYGLEDVVVDCENKMFTHRPDCFGNLGVARELAGISGLKFKSPEWYTTAPKFSNVSGLPLEVRVTAEDLVPRFMALAIKDVKVGPSPIWMQAGLARVGIRPINNIVDITNFVMHLTGQPLHAYDYDKVKARSGSAPTLVARAASKDEKLKLLNGKTITLDPSVVVIATDKEAVGVAGVMGGADTEVDEHTKNIILECATFDMYNIRRTSMKLGLFTDAVTRFNKGQSPLQNDRILAYAAQQVREYAGGTVSGAVKDVKNLDDKIFSPVTINKPVEVAASFINERLGSNLSATDMKKLLENVEISVDEDGDNLTVVAPFWRTDIELPEDVVEEVGRLHGFADLPITLPVRTTKPAPIDSMLALKDRVRDDLARAGANEVLSYSFVHGNLLNKVGQDSDQAYRLSNALSPDLQYYRLSITPSLLDKVYKNIRSGHEQLAVFEMGKVHTKTHPNDGDEQVPKEFNSLALVVSASNKQAKTFAGAAFYQAKQYVDFLLGQFGVKATYEPITNDLNYAVAKPFEKSRSAIIKDSSMGAILGIVGEYRQSVMQALKLPVFTAGAELGLDELLAVAKPQKIYQVLSRFPGVSADITFRTMNPVSYAQLTSAVEAALSQASQPHGIVATIHATNIFRADDQQSSRNITYRIDFSHPDRTLTIDESNSLVEQVVLAIQKQALAERV